MNIKRLSSKIPTLLLATLLMGLGQQVFAQVTVQAENYSAMSGVQVETTTDVGGGQNIGWLDANDWLSYNVNLPATGTYTLSLRVASLNGGGVLRIEKAGGGTTYATINIPKTSGWQTWQTITQVVTLPAGQQNIGLAIVSGGFNLNWIKFDSLAASSSSSSKSSNATSSSRSSVNCALNTTIEAEAYQSMSGIQTESTTDIGGGINVGWIDNGDWLTLPAVNIPANGDYKISYRVASPYTDGRIQLERASGGLVYGVVNTPSTDGWQNWTTISHTVSLSAGLQTFTLRALTGGYNINWISIESTSSTCVPASSSSSSSSSSDRNRYVAPKTNTAPIIDGNVDALWDKAPWAPIDVFWLGSQRPSAQDFSGRYKAMWDAGNLYLLFDITDDVLLDAHANPVDNYWNDDSVEIFIDENKNGGFHQTNTSAWAYHVSIFGDVIDSTNSDVAKNLKDHITMRMVRSGNKQMWEMSMRVYGEDYADNKVNTPVPLFAGKLMGFSVCYNDNDNSQERESMIGSVDTQGHKDNQGYINASVFGSMLLTE